ncbi:MAG: 50S ribosomal protein L17 [Thermodesulfobacteriota bacterium]|nr:50S ribosomal protein L17 [Thermodesulfobacteriota bacterium]
MRHRVRKGKLGLKTGHRISLLRNLCTELFRHGRITTTDAKAKELRRFSEKIITLAKNDTVHSRRLVNTKIKDREVMAKLFDTIGPSFSNRPGGYTRIIKLNYRKGDAAPVSSIELVGLDVPFKPKDDSKDEVDKTRAQTSD